MYTHAHVCTVIIRKQYSHFLAATFDFTTFFTQAFYKAAPFFYSLAVFVWIVYTDMYSHAHVYTVILRKQLTTQVSLYIQVQCNLMVY